MLIIGVSHNIVLFILLFITLILLTVYYINPVHVIEFKLFIVQQIILAFTSHTNLITELTLTNALLLNLKLTDSVLFRYRKQYTIGTKTQTIITHYLSNNNLKYTSLALLVFTYFYVTYYIKYHKAHVIDIIILNLTSTVDLKIRTNAISLIALLTLNNNSTVQSQGPLYNIQPTLQTIATHMAVLLNK